MSEFEKLLPNICDSIAKTAAHVISYADDDSKQELLDALRSNVQNYTENSQKFQNINGLISRLSSGNSDTDIEEILKNFNDGVSSFQLDSSRNEFLKQYDTRVADLKKNLAGGKSTEGGGDDEDADMQMTEEDGANLICPISKVRMTEPMKNNICGHVYDKASIIALLKGNAATRCPIVGCSNKKHLIMEDLTSDIVRQMCM
ncbi:GSCOCG00008315001-RA-CDS [Cotesia congregata]|nr:GSCOCG00008315001-RA-CDS [Cotesia congregata]